MAVFSALFLLLTTCGSLQAKKFPDSFHFGVAGSAYQTEGAWNEDGKGQSMWDTFAHIPGKIKNNDTGDIACDSYHKFEEDIQILDELGVQLYRLSISWTRILPDGTPAKVNQPGINYYLKIFKELKSKGIKPIVTLYHWDLPQHLLDLGGWLNPQIADYFSAFARIAFDNFGSYVKYWITLNEPITYCFNGYAEGVIAPGLKLPGDGIYQCAYVSLLAHAKAYRIYDKEFRAAQKGKITINIGLPMLYAKTNSTKDLEAQERTFEFLMGLYTNPVYKGNWPQIVMDRIANRSKTEGYPFSRLPELTQKEIDLINGTYDYFALNSYTSNLVQYLPDINVGFPFFIFDKGTRQSLDSSWPKSSESWLRSDPPGMRHLLNYIQDKYNPNEIIITENGWPDLGDLDDTGRITYLKGYLSNILDAILEDRINVTGYTLWSLLDNFEWTNGYTPKYGIIKVDFDNPNRTRTWKSSAKWYQKVIAKRRIID